MPDLIHPETGQHTWADPDTAERLINEDGWELHPSNTLESAPESADELDTDDDESGAENDDDDDEGTDAPQLDGMKLTELITHAESIGVPAETLEPLRMPGASKAQAIEIINEHTAS